jgi:hypothetical protein
MTDTFESDVSLTEIESSEWRQECAAKVGLGFMLPADRSKPLLDKSGQVFEVEIAEAVAQ